jgi:CheY-like chemotaxis protein
MAGTVQTVLLIEDEPLVRMGTSAMLEDSGYAVLEAANADEAHGILADHPEISIVVTDVQMPGSMDGLAFAALVRRDYAHIPVLVASGRAQRVDAQQHGAASYISKPYTAQAISQALMHFNLREAP